MLHTNDTRRQKAAVVAASNLETHQKMASAEYDWNNLPKTKVSEQIVETSMQCALYRGPSAAYERY